MLNHNFRKHCKDLTVSKLLFLMKWLHFHFRLNTALVTGLASWYSHRFYARVKWTHQPVEWRVVDQIIHDVVSGFSHALQLTASVAKHCVGQVAQSCSIVEPGVDIHSHVANGQRLLLDVLWQTLEVGHEGETSRL